MIIAILKCMHELHINVPINAIFENVATNAKKIVALWNKFQQFRNTFHYHIPIVFFLKHFWSSPIANFVGVESHGAPAVLYFFSFFF